MKKIYWMAALVVIIIGLALIVKLSITKPPDISFSEKNSTPIPSLFQDQEFFLNSIQHAKPASIQGTITGITVPHHLLARDLAADIFASIKGQYYSCIIIISPDHYNLGKTSVSIASQDLATVFGTAKTDQDLVKDILTTPETAAADFFYREHGIQTLLPFIKYYFPDTPVAAIAIQGDAKKSELDPLVEKMEGKLDARTLIVQSADYSHYLSPKQAEIKDQETISILKLNNPEKIFNLHQPDNIDSIAAQYIQSRLQKEFFQSNLKIIARRNSQFYSSLPVTETTSYITQIYSQADKAKIGEVVK